MGARAKRSPIQRRLRREVTDTILDAAEQVAVEVGLGGITIAAVAGRAGVAVGTLYNYFPDGDAMLAALFRARRRAIAPRIAAALVATKRLRFEDRLREFVRLLLAVFEHQQRFLRVAALADRDGARTKPRDTALVVQTIAAFEQIMRDGARRKLFPVSRVPIYARMMHGALRSMFLWRWCAGDQPISADADLVVETFLHGVLR